MTYYSADPALQREFEAITSIAHGGNAPALRARANDLALRMRSRLIDLACWRADAGSEYRTLADQCRQLTTIAGPDAHALLVREFGP